MATAPLVTVLVAVCDGEPYVRTALESILRQSVSDLELLVVDDGSSDATPKILDEIDDERLRVLRNAERQGLASSLNRGLEDARGRYVARLDADDVALPRRLERQLARIRSGPPVAVVGSAVLDVAETGRLGTLHVMPSGPGAVRWASLFSSPFFHPSVLADREVLEAHELRYDSDYLESEDYDLWTRLLAVADGDNLRDPLTLYRVHPGQASQARRELQRDFQRRVALREIERIAPELDPESAELAWLVGAGEPVDAEQLEDAAGAVVDLVEAFEKCLQQTVAKSSSDGRLARKSAARALARASLRGTSSAHRNVLRLASRLDPAVAVRVAGRRASRAAIARGARRDAEKWLLQLEDSRLQQTVASAPSDRSAARRSGSRRSSRSRRRTARRSSTASPGCPRST